MTTTSPTPSLIGRRGAGLLVVAVIALLIGIPVTINAGDNNALLVVGGILQWVGIVCIVIGLGMIAWHLLRRPRDA